MIQWKVSSGKYIFITKAYVYDTGRTIMLILRGNKVIDLDTREDSLQDLIIVKSLEQLNKEYPSGSYFVQDCIGTIKLKYGSQFERSYYWGKRIQSEFSDGGGMDSGLVGISDTKGQFIADAWKHNYRVYIKQPKADPNDEDIWIELTKEGPKQLVLRIQLYYTKSQTEQQVAFEENSAAFRNERADH